MIWPDHTLHDPAWLWALAALPLIWWLRSLRGAAVLVVPFAGAWHRGGAAPLTRWPMTLASLGLMLVIGALARPQFVQQRQEEHKEGYDLVLAIDLSRSMLTPDYVRAGFRVNRFQAVQPVVDEFVSGRLNDRIGLVVFSAHAYTLAPLTSDHDWLRRQLQQLKVGIIGNTTALGDGLGVALTRLEQAKREAAGKRLGAFIILLTDGINNCGALEPMQAAAIAKARGIPVYTIAASRFEADERTLQAIARETGGEFFRATDSGTIEAAFKAIDRAQKIEFEAKSYLLTEELFAWFAVPGAVLLLAAAMAARPGRLSAPSDKHQLAK